MKKLLNFLFSFPFMGFLLLVLAFSMAIATFVESSYGTQAAQGLIYKSFWFGLILFLLAVNLLVNFVRHKMSDKINQQIDCQQKQYKSKPKGFIDQPLGCLGSVTAFDKCRNGHRKSQYK